MKAPSKLFTPIKIGPIEVKNRIVMPAMVSGRARGDGKPTEAHINWYARRAQGGVGLIIIELTAVDPGGAGGPHVMGIWDDAFIPSFTTLVKAIHAHNAKVFLQICHMGRSTATALTGGKLPVAPSAIVSPFGPHEFHEIPKELSIEEIEEIIEKFGQAARRTREAGFDGLEIHGAHGYLIAQFMSAFSNKRSDAYGGDLLARLRFPIEVIRRVRREVGKDFPVIFRMSGNEFVPDGRTIEESKMIAPILEEVGVDCFHISAGTDGSFWAITQPYGVPDGFLVNDAIAIKQVVSMPVMVVGRIKTPMLAEQIIAQGKADMVAMGRQLICDPDWPKKVAAGAFEDIRPCIGCIQGCIERAVKYHVETSCLLNPTAGNDKETMIKLAQKRKKVLVVGGGPGGLEAARVAALRGHQVTLIEKTEKLGGQFNLAAVAPFKQEYASAIKWFITQVKKLGVQVELGKEVTPALVEKIGPDAVIVATGGVAEIPQLPGVSKQLVVTAHDLLAGKVSNFGTRVVVVGGGMVGCEVADFLCQRDIQVTIVEMLPEIGELTGIPSAVWQLLKRRLRDYQARLVTSAKVEEITDDGVIATVNGKKETITGMDRAILAVGAKPVDELSKKIEGKVAEVYVIGDAKEPRTAYEAIHEGAEVARKI